MAWQPKGGKKQINSGGRKNIPIFLSTLSAPSLPFSGHKVFVRDGDAERGRGRGASALASRSGEEEAGE